MDKDVIKRIMDLAQPLRGYEEQCRRHAIASLDRIAAPIPKPVHTREVREQLRQLAAAMSSAREAIGQVPQEWHYLVFSEINPEDLARDLIRIGQSSEQLADSLDVGRSGGAKSEHEEAARKRIAADCAFDLLNDWGGPSPTKTVTGPYLLLASLLYEIATGQKEKDLSRACASHFKELQREGFPSGKELRQMRRVATAPAWLDGYVSVDEKADKEK